MIPYFRKASRPAVFEVITRNDDFTDRKTDVPAILRARRPLGMLVQEGKNTDYRALLGERYLVVQDMSTPATAGVAVIVDKHQIERSGTSGHVPLVSAKGLLPRGVTWVQVMVDGERIVLASAHRPPQRNSRDWPAFDRALRKWKAGIALPIVLGMDTNVPGKPARKRREMKRLAASYGMRYRGRKLDAVFVRRTRRGQKQPRLVFAHLVARLYARMRSDHHPIGALFRVKKGALR